MKEEIFDMEKDISEFSALTSNLSDSSSDEFSSVNKTKSLNRGRGRGYRGRGQRRGRIASNTNTNQSKEVKLDSSYYSNRDNIREFYPRENHVSSSQIGQEPQHQYQQHAYPPQQQQQQQQQYYQYQQFQPSQQSFQNYPFTFQTEKEKEIRDQQGILFGIESLSLQSNQNQNQPQLQSQIQQSQSQSQLQSQSQPLYSTKQLNLQRSYSAEFQSTKEQFPIVSTSTSASARVKTQSPKEFKFEGTRYDEKSREISGKHDSDVVVAKRPVTLPQKQMGRTIQLLTNHFRFDVREQTIYQYSVEFLPEVESTAMKGRLMDEQKDLFGSTYIFDGSMLFILNKLEDMELKSVDGNTIIIIHHTIELAPGNIPLQLCNLMFRTKILRRLRLKLIGRNYFDPSRSIPIPKHNVQLWPGFLTAVNPTQIGIMLVADVTHKVLRTDSVLDYMHELSEKFPRNWKQVANDQLIGQIILTGYNNRTYRVDGIMWDQNPASTFKKRNGEEFSYMEYYLQTYKIKITDLNQPLLVHKHRRKGGDDIIYLIPQLCSMTGITESMRNDFSVMKDISNYTRVLPGARATELEAFLRSINENPEVSKDMQAWGMKINPQLLPVEGRILDPEKIIFKTKSIYAESKTAEWSSMCKNSELIYSVPLNNWLLVHTVKNSKLAEDFAQNLAKVAASVGFPVAKPNYLELPDDRKNTFIDAIKQNITDQVQCVVCILPTPSKDRYDAIKQACCIELPLPSQCILQKSLKEGKNLLSVCNKIALQMNCKLGGELWRLEIPLIKTMLVGIDVYHDTMSKGLSVAGFCASYNSNFTKYNSFGCFQKTGQELVDGLKQCMMDALRRYFEVNRFMPEIIIVYRDGVGDGMLEAVVDHEIPQMKQTFAEFGENYKPRLSVIVVKKRIHARLFYDKNQNNSVNPTTGNFTSSNTGNTPNLSSVQNPPPGTVVDSGCVHKDWYDFFLVSQSVRQGTVTPTHYHVVYDTTGIQPTYIQMLTYKMCHLYYNWPGTIRVPAPCQYAHAYAYLVGQSLHDLPSSHLMDKLFYL